MILMSEPTFPCADWTQEWILSASWAHALGAAIAAPNAAVATASAVNAVLPKRTVRNLPPRSPLCRIAAISCEVQAELRCFER
jgi:hypothetical protein